MAAHGPTGFAALPKVSIQSAHLDSVIEMILPLWRAIARAGPELCKEEMR